MAPRLNILIAYPYLKPDLIQLLASCGPALRFTLDSGAFTAWKAGKPIQLDDYCRFLEQLPIKPWRYFTLDVIGDSEGTLKNYETMLKRGFKPVPISTRGEDTSVLDQFYKTSDLVGVGGLVGTPGNRGFVKGIMRHIGKRPVHWLGFTDMDFIRAYRPFMCDSSSWESGARYGELKLYMGRGQFRAVKKAPFKDEAVHVAVCMSKAAPAWWMAAEVVSSSEWLVFPWEDPAAAKSEEESYRASRQ